MQKTQETLGLSLDWEDPLEEEMATHSSILAWKNPMDKGTWWATVLEVTKESDTTEQLHFHFHIHIYKYVFMYVLSCFNRVNSL